MVPLMTVRPPVTALSAPKVNVPLSKKVVDVPLLAGVMATVGIGSRQSGREGRRLAGAAGLGLQFAGQSAGKGPGVRAALGAGHCHVASADSQQGKPRAV